MFSALIEFLFPTTEHEKTLRNVTTLTPTPALVHTAVGTTVLSCARFTEPSVRAAIKLLKKRGDPKAAQLLAHLVHDTLLEELADVATWNPEQFVITPVPVSPSRKRTRGFSHLELVFLHLPTSLRDLAQTTLLLQTKNTRMQKTLTKQQRLENVRGVFSITRDANLSGVHVILVDDVVATGATLQSAARALENAGANVTQVALARA